MPPDERKGPAPGATGAAAAFRNHNIDDLPHRIPPQWHHQPQLRLDEKIRKMAEAVANDGLARVPIADRIEADLVLEKERRGFAITEEDLDRVRRAFERRQRELAARASDYLDR